MKTIVFIKAYPIIQIGHMYEHLYAIALVEKLRNHKLYEFVDYYLSGHTYDSGVVELEIEVYSTAVEEVISKLNSISPIMDEDEIMNVWNAIEAEERSFLGFTSHEEIKSSLQDINNQEWQRLDKIDFIKKLVIPDDQSPLYTAEGKYRGSNSLQITFSFKLQNDQQDTELLPLFDQVSRAIGYNAQYMITRELGLYYENIEGKYEAGEMKTYLEFLAYPEFEMDAKDIHDDIVDLIDELKNGGMFKRLVSLLAPSDATSYKLFRPGLKNIYERTNQIIGGEGWNRIVTNENVEYLLKNMVIEVSRIPLKGNNKTRSVHNKSILSL